MRTVLIKKLNTLEGAVHPDTFLPSDYKSSKMLADDTVFEKPVVGESFNIDGILTWFRSSVVQEILEDNETSGKFRTINSIYHWELTEQEIPQSNIETNE